jgi:hypothetical protein
MWLLVWILNAAAIAVPAARYTRARKAAADHRRH